MIKINTTIPVADLTDSTLMDECFGIESIMLQTLVDKVPNKISSKNHLKFFHNKRGYLLMRWEQLYYEGRKRGLRVKNIHHLWNGVDPSLKIPYRP